MSDYIVDLSTPHANLFEVLRHYPVSTNEKAHALEKRIKESAVLPVDELVERLTELPPAERNFVLACFIAWTCEPEFTRALHCAKLKQKVHVAQETGNWEFGDYYYSYHLTLAQWRRLALKTRISAHQTELMDLTSQMAKLDAAEPALAA